MKLIDLILEDNNILKPRKTGKDREAQYIKVGEPELSSDEEEDFDEDSILEATYEDYQVKRDVERFIKSNDLFSVQLENEPFWSDGQYGNTNGWKTKFKYNDVDFILIFNEFIPDMYGEPGLELEIVSDYENKKIIDDDSIHVYSLSDFKNGLDNFYKQYIKL